MRPEKWYKVLEKVVFLVLIIILDFMVGYFIVTNVFSNFSLSNEFLIYLSMIFISFLLWVLSWYLYFFLHRVVLHGKDNIRSFRSQLLVDTLDAMEKISQGNFNIKIASNERDPYNELASNVNKMAKELSSLEKLRQDFISDVSHEIQSPLTSISGFAAMLKQEGLSEALIFHYADIIENESRRLSKLSENLLRLSSFEVDSFELEKREFRLDKQLESIILMFEPQWSAKGISLDVSLEKVTLLGDETLLSQVWINLIQNAIKFTPDQGEIKISLKEKNDNLVVTLSDSGVGISKSDQMHVFERFYKVDKSRSRELGGNGLGLSIVRKIIDLHGWQIKLESELEKGTTFTITAQRE
ncbi:sensor histidine kinase [Fusibacter bizertensis]